MGCIWFDVCWCYVAVLLWWCGIRRQAEALRAVLLWWCGIRMQAEALRAVLLWWCGIRMQAEARSASACIRIPHHHSNTAT